ncbi:MAG TPA: hypothetical protein VHC46_03800, partial [Thermodesulfobacteriota bacterium]|nr:hypothetical protein [Thermodesulfobacteriota bacterium]
VTGGLSALATDIITDVVVGEYSEAANLSPGASMALSAIAGGGPSLAKGAIAKGTMSKALGRELGDLAGDEARALRQTEGLLSDEARALNKTETALSDIHPNERLNMSENAVGNTSTGGGSRGNSGSGAGGVNQGTGGGPGGGGTSGTIPSRPPGGGPKMPEYKVAIKPEYAEELADHLVNNSVWMQEIEQIYRIADLETRYARIQTFMQNYSRSTGIKIEVIPEHMAGRYGIGPKNWGTYLPDQQKILFHEGIFTKPGVNPVQQIGHEVGVAELERVLGIPKDSIPKVYDVPPPYSSLTHIVDRRIKPVD